MITLFIIIVENVLIFFLYIKPSMFNSKIELFRVNRTVVQMLEDRGYQVPLRYDKFDEFNDVNEADLEQTAVHKQNPKLTCAIFWCNEQLNVSQLKLIVDRMKNMNNKHSIVILQNDITDKAKSVISELSEKIEYFKRAELIINITRHVLMPQHFILNDNQKQDLLNFYLLKNESQLPKMLVSDPIAKYYGAHKGQIMMISRTSDQGIDYIGYRCIV